MRVAMIAPFGLRPKGTLAQRALPLAQALTQQGAAVRIVAPAYLNPADAGQREVHGGVEVVHVGLPHLAGPLAFLETAAALVRAAWNWQPDLVHVFKPKGYSGLAATLLHHLHPQLPIIQDTDDWEGWGGWNDLQPYSRPMKHFFAWQERSLPRQATAVTVASRTLQTQVWGFGIDRDRVLYLPNGVADPLSLLDRSRARQALGLGNEPVVLLYTRFWEYPLRMLIECLIGLAAQIPQARLLVLGAGEHHEETRLQELAARAGVAHLLDQRGWVDRATIDQALAAADVAIMPFADTLMNRAKCSVKLLELLNAGVPVVASAVGQATEYIRAEQTGLLVTPGDGGALARGVIRLLANEQRSLIGQAGQQFVQQHWNWNRLAQEVQTCYRASLHAQT